MKHTYEAAGVSIDAADKLKHIIAGHAKAASRPEVLAGPGLFGGMFELKGFQQPVLVSSVDGVGTKLKIAGALDMHYGVGVDIVNHSVNDILTCGAEPLFFLDYIAMGKLSPDRVATIVQGLSNACQEVGCALIGGETAEMPGLYAGEDYDLAGCIVGAVEKDNIIDGTTIAAGDITVGLPSSGLHTNGYSLARKIFGETREELEKRYPELDTSIGETLLIPHRCYYHQLKPLLPVIKGMAHITGGGLPGNVPRILPEGLAVRFDSQTWEVPPIFQLIQQQGQVDRNEMYHVFNMGIGMVVFCSSDSVKQIIQQLPEAVVIGQVTEQSGQQRVIIE